MPTRTWHRCSKTSLEAAWRSETQLSQPRLLTPSHCQRLSQRYWECLQGEGRGGAVLGAVAASSGQSPIPHPLLPTRGWEGYGSS